MRSVVGGFELSSQRQPTELERLLALAKRYEAEGRADQFPKEHVQAILDLRERQRLENSLYSFLQAAWHVIVPGREFIGGKHIEAICEHLEAVTAGKISRLLINV